MSMKDRLQEALYDSLNNDTKPCINFPVRVCMDIIKECGITRDDVHDIIRDSCCRTHNGRSCGSVTAANALLTIFDIAEIE